MNSWAVDDGYQGEGVEASEEDALQLVMTRYSGVLASALDASPIEGASVCAASHPAISCVQTDSSGAYAIDLPGDTRVELEIVKEGYIPIRTNLLTSRLDSSFSAVLYPPAIMQMAVEAIGETYDAKSAWLMVRSHDPIDEFIGVAGVTVNVLPPDGDGPYYSSGGLTFTVGGAGTTSSGTAFFWNLEERTYSLGLSSETYACLGTRVSRAFDGHLEAVMKAGFATYVYVDCPRK